MKLPKTCSNGHPLVTVVHDRQRGRVLTCPLCWYLWWDGPDDENGEVTPGVIHALSREVVSLRERMSNTAAMWEKKWQQTLPAWEEVAAMDPIVALATTEPAVWSCIFCKGHSRSQDWSACQHLPHCLWVRAVRWIGDRYFTIEHVPDCNCFRLYLRDSGEICEGASLTSLLRIGLVESESLTEPNAACVARRALVMTAIEYKDVVLAEMHENGDTLGPYRDTLLAQMHLSL